MLRRRMLLLQHLDDIDDIIEACQRHATLAPFNRDDFRQMVQLALQVGRPLAACLFCCMCFVCWAGMQSEQMAQLALHAGRLWFSHPI